MNLNASDLRPFIPAKDFALSRSFYQALGWKEAWADDTMVLLELDDCRFYLQAYYVKDWADNCMLHISVQDAQAWHSHVAQVLASGQFPGARVAPPKAEPYGATVTYVWDPSGVLLHLAQLAKAL